MSFWCLYCWLWTDITHFLVFLLLTLNKLMPVGKNLRYLRIYLVRDGLDAMHIARDFERLSSTSSVSSMTSDRPHEVSLCSFKCIYLLNDSISVRSDLSLKVYLLLKFAIQLNGIITAYQKVVPNKPQLIFSYISEA